jgi:hypothetical protein
MTAIPEYWNSQSKVVYNIDSRNKLMFNAVGGWDYIKVEDENRPDLRGAENVEHTGYQYTAGVTYKSLFSKQGYSLISAGRTTAAWDADVYQYNNGIKDNYFTRDNKETDTFVKGDVVYKFSPNLEISTGANCKYGEYSLNEISNPDTVFEYTYQYNNQDIINITDVIGYYTLIDTLSNHQIYII